MGEQVTSSDYIDVYALHDVFDALTDEQLDHLGYDVDYSVVRLLLKYIDSLEESRAFPQA